MNKMLCDSNSVSLMSIDNSSSSEPIKKFSPKKIANNSWWDEVEAAEQTVFEQEDAVNAVIQQPITCNENTNTVKKIAATMDPDMLTFSNKIKAKAEEIVDDVVVKEAVPDVNESNASNSRDISSELVNGVKCNRLVGEVKSKTPFKRRLSGDSRSNSPISFFPTDNIDDHNDAVEASIKDEYNQDDEKESGAASSHSHNSIATGRGHGKRRRCNMELETCAEILARRQKQIDYGKNTIGYDNYIKQIPRNERLKDHPWTPPKQFKYSRRAFDGLIKGWRTKLHCFDPPNNNGNDRPSSESDDDEEK